MILNNASYPRKNYPTKAIQFGEGNFLRAFIDWQFDLLNEHTDFNTGITIIRPINSLHPKLDNQDGLYTTLIRGLNEKGEKESTARVIQSVNKEVLAYQEFDQYLLEAENPDLEWVISNTTEAGIKFNDTDKLHDQPASTFPGKLTQFLLHRFTTFNGDINKGLIFLPCELIDYNGEELKKCIEQYIYLWDLGHQFQKWINEANTFCSTLVDRIVTGYPKDEIQQIESALGYQDNFLVTAEHFYLFVIQGPDWLKDKLKLNQYPLNINVVDDIKSYKERKVAILNGAHTSMVPVAYLSGFDTVRESIEDEYIQSFVDNLIRHEVIPMIKMPQEELLDFYNSVISRFKNPYIQHNLLSISLNSFAKFKARVLPQLISYSKTYHQAPAYTSFSLAALICFYQGTRENETYELNDDLKILNNFKEWQPLFESNIQQLTINVLGMTEHWGEDLNSVPKLTETVSSHISNIKQHGIKKAMNQLIA